MTKTTTTVSINGQLYDAVTGLPVSSEKPQLPVVTTSVVAKKTPQKTQATHLHKTQQKSTTLRRSSTKRPTAVNNIIVQHKVKKAVETQPVTIHPQVRKFAAHPVGALHPAPKSMDIGPVAHPHVVKAHALSEAKSQPQPTVTAQSIKNQAVKNAIANTEKQPPLRTRLFPKRRVATVLSAVVALVLFGSYLTYLNMPNLSVRVAAIQAGIDAEYPEYRPDGYSLNGPVAYSDGSVSMNFAANGGPQHFAIKQSRSDWDSTALLDKYITPKAGTSYIPYTERGLTIYTYDNNAAWINAGILYTIEGDAPLSSEQIRRIATSLL